MRLLLWRFPKSVSGARLLALCGLVGGSELKQRGMQLACRKQDGALLMTVRLHWHAL